MGEGHTVNSVHEGNCQLPAGFQTPQDYPSLTSSTTETILDTQGYLRCGGHIHNAPVSETTKFPYLLPSRHQFFHLIILDIHVTLHHTGTGATLTALRQTYWIPAARHYIKSILRHCVICNRVLGKPYSAPDRPTLPYLRTQDVHPFTYTGWITTRNTKNYTNKYLT